MTQRKCAACYDEQVDVQEFAVAQRIVNGVQYHYGNELRQRVERHEFEKRKRCHQRSSTLLDNVENATYILYFRRKRAGS